MQRRLLVALALLAAVGCGRRGPPQPPLEVLPGAPEVEPILQEDGELLLRWTAPTTDDDGRLQELRLRRAVLEMRVLDLHELAFAQAAAESAPEPEPEEEPDPPGDALAEGEPEDVAPEAEAPVEGEPDAPATGDPPEPEPVAPEEDAPEAAEGEPDAPATEDPPEPASEEPPMEPEPEPPREMALQYDDVHFEPFDRIESESPGATHIRLLPIRDEWVGRRVEFRLFYESATGAGDPADLLSLDVTGDLPGVDGVEADVGDGVVALAWNDVRATGGAEAAARLSQPVYEVFRRRGEGEERLGRALGPAYSDTEVAWGEEACYSVRLVMAAATEERTISIPAEGDAEPVPVLVPAASAGGLSAGAVSEAVCVTPVDVFAPPAPRDLRAIPGAEHTDLSWLPVTAPDLAGYHVYRAGESGGFERRTEAPLERADWRDADRDPGALYRYRVTAVDRASPPNESAPGEEVAVRPR